MEALGRRALRKDKSISITFSALIPFSGIKKTILFMTTTLLCLPQGGGYDYDHQRLWATSPSVGG